MIGKKSRIGFSFSCHARYPVVQAWDDDWKEEKADKVKGQCPFAFHFCSVIRWSLQEVQWTDNEDWPED